MDVLGWMKSSTAKATIVLAFIGMCWTFAKPYAEDVIRGEVDKNVGGRIGKIEQAQDDLKKEFINGKIVEAGNNGRNENRLSNLEKGQEEIQRDLKDILRGLKSRGIVDN